MSPIAHKIVLTQSSGISPSKGDRGSCRIFLSVTALFCEVKW